MEFNENEFTEDYRPSWIFVYANNEIQLIGKKSLVSRIDEVNDNLGGVFDIEGVSSEHFATNKSAPEANPESITGLLEKYYIFNQKNKPQKKDQTKPITPKIIEQKSQ